MHQKYQVIYLNGYGDESGGRRTNRLTDRLRLSSILCLIVSIIFFFTISLGVFAEEIGMSESQTTSSEKTSSELKKEDPVSVEDLNASLKSLKLDLEKMKKDLEKKQNIPDSSKKFTCKLGGMMSVDTVFINQSELNETLYGDINNGYGFRDIRLWARGEGYKNLSYDVGFGFNNGISIKNVMLTVSDVPIMGEMRVGYFKVESGIGYASNICHTTFFDFDSNTRTFQVARRLGLASIHFSENKNYRLFAGIFTGQNLEINGNKEYAGVNNDNVGLLLNTRLSGVPIYHEDGDGNLLEVLHLGAGYRWVDPGNNSDTGKNNKTTLRCSPLTWMTNMPYLLNGGLDTDSYTTTNIEAAWQKKQFGIVGEGFIGTYDGYDNSYGVTLTSRLLLTPGAYQKYNKSNGTFSEVYVPKNLCFVDYGDYCGIEGTGVWEAAVQWAYTDLNNLQDVHDAGVCYGTLNQFMVELNWYWNPNTCWALNWIHAMPDSMTNNSMTNNTTEKSSNDTISCQLRIMF